MIVTINLSIVDSITVVAKLAKSFGTCPFRKSLRLPLRTNRTGIDRVVLRHFVCSLRSTCFVLVTALLFASSVLAVDNQVTPETLVSVAHWQSLSVYPPNIKLSAKSDTQHVALVATRSDGITLDVTDQAQWSFANADLAKLDDFVVSAKADGVTQLTAQWQGLSATASLDIANSQQIGRASCRERV